jgi:hypothetical protein
MCRPLVWTSTTDEEDKPMRALVSAARTTSADRLLPQFARLMRERDPVVVVRLPRTEITFVLVEAARDGVSVEAMLRTLGKEGLPPASRDVGAGRLRLPIDAASDVNALVTWLVRRAIRRRRRNDPRQGEHAHPGPRVERH